VRKWFVNAKPLPKNPVTIVIIGLNVAITEISLKNAISIIIKTRKCENVRRKVVSDK